MRLSAVDVSFTNVAIVAAVAFAAPLALGLAPGLRLPAVVLEIVLGIVVGPQVLDWAHRDAPVRVMSLVGLAFLLLLAGLEVDFERLRGRVLRLAGLGFAASIADIATIVLLSLFFSGESASTGSKVVLLGGFVVLVGAIALAVTRAERSMRLSSALVRLQDTTAQIRVRGAFLLLALFVVLADRFGLEAILGAFLAGAVLKLVDRDEQMTHAFFHP